MKHEIKKDDCIFCRLDAMVNVIIHALVQAGIDDDDVIVDAVVTALGAYLED